MEQKYDVFISSKSSDYPIAEELRDFLINNGRSVFLASKELQRIGESEYSRIIDEALDRCHHLVVVATSVENINSKWVSYEWRTFSNDIKSGYRTGNLITILSDEIKLQLLPASLRHQQSFTFSIYRDNILDYLRLPDTQVVENHKKTNVIFSAKSIPLKPNYIDLGLPSETIWKKQSERGLYTFKDALQKYGQCIPSKDMYHELLNKCEWTWEENGYKVTGPNGNSIKLLAQGYQSGSQILDENGCGHYWTNKLQTDTYAYALEFSPNNIEIREHFISYARAVHLIDA